MLVTLIANIYLQSVGYLFVLFIVSFAVPKLLSLSRSHLCILVFISIILGDRLKRILLWFMSERVLPVFSSKSFVVFSLTLRSLINLEVIFVCDVKEWFHFFACKPRVPSTVCWRYYLSGIVYSCLFCHRLIDLRCMGLFRGFLSCISVFCASTILFWWL